jgi:carboxypeptidase C (cathepsin A)
LWGWDRSSNLLYIDQPNQVGLSFDKTVNGSLDLMQQNLTFPPSENAGPGPAYTYLKGTFSSQEWQATANTSQIAARAVWHFLQTFLNTFPEYNPGKQPNDTETHPTGVNLFTESYGGTYGPVFADYFEHQNDLLRVGQLPAATTLEIELVSLGIMNGLVDFRIQAPFFPIYASNNTYDIKAISASEAQTALTNMAAPDNCFARLDQCRNLQDTQDNLGKGDVMFANRVCSQAFQTCAEYQNLLSSSGRDVYDIRQKTPSPFPSWAFMEYLNTAQVQQAVGIPINYTDINPVLDTFISTGDHLRGTQLPALGRLLDRGIRVALIYGDADFICNWLGGEAISLSLATMLPFYSIPFPYAGYAQIVVNNSYVGGAVRQFGNLSFSRIYDAGHLVPAYQPETAFTVFTRIIQGTAISTGERIDLGTYTTNGTQFSTKSNKAGTSKDPVCWIRQMMQTCTPEQRTAILAGKGMVMGGVWYEDASDYRPPTSSVEAGSPGRPAPNATVEWSSGKPSVPATGVYTATGTPSPSAAGSVMFARGRRRWAGLMLGQIVMVLCFML